MNRKILTIMAILTASAIYLTGCGSKDTKSPVSNTETSSVADTTTSTEASVPATSTADTSASTTEEGTVSAESDTSVNTTDSSDIETAEMHFDPQEALDFVNTIDLLGLDISEIENSSFSVKWNTSGRVVEEHLVYDANNAFESCTTKFIIPDGMTFEDYCATYEISFDSPDEYTLDGNICTLADTSDIFYSNGVIDKSMSLTDAHSTVTLYYDNVIAPYNKAIEDYKALGLNATVDDYTTLMMTIMSMPVDSSAESGTPTPSDTTSETVDTAGVTEATAE